jgi:hypothetical protein
MRQWLQWLSLLPLLTGGCSSLLWHNVDWSNRPAANPNLRLFQAERQQDLLVVYDEYSERTRSTRARAYLLNRNQSRVAQGERPRFVSTRITQGLPAVTVLPDSMAQATNSLPALYAVVSTNTGSFLVYTNHQLAGTNDLPIYPDPLGKVERIAFSPVAITVDVVLVAGIVYFAVVAPNTDAWPDR